MGDAHPLHVRAACTLGGHTRLKLRSHRRLCEHRGGAGPISAALAEVPNLHRAAGIFTATVLWVRDPVDRVVSVLSAMEIAKPLFDAFARDSRAASQALEQRIRCDNFTRDFESNEHRDEACGHIAKGCGCALLCTNRDGHLIRGRLAWYIDDLEVLERGMPPLFVGRTENFVADFDRLLDWSSATRRPLKVRHQHKAAREHVELPAVRLARGVVDTARADGGVLRRRPPPSSAGGRLRTTGCSNGLPHEGTWTPSTCGE